MLDATWSSSAQRARARILAEETSSDLTELRCVLPADQAAARIRLRLRNGGDPSEATPELASTLLDRFDPWPTAHALSTADSPTEAADRAADLFPDHGVARPGPSR